MTPEHERRLRKTLSMMSFQELKEYAVNADKMRLDLKQRVDSLEYEKKIIHGNAKSRPVKNKLF